MRSEFNKVIRESVNYELCDHRFESLLVQLVSIAIQGGNA